jgi:hypothetical protein
MLDQILATRSIVEHRGLQLARHIELVKPREKDGLDLLLLVALGDQVAAQDFEPALACPNLLPEVRRAMSGLRVHRVARCAVVALVERQEHGGRAVELGHHVNLAVAHREVHECAARKFLEKEAFTLDLPMRRHLPEPFDAGRLHGGVGVQSFGDGVGDDGLAFFFQQFH